MNQSPDGMTQVMGTDRRIPEDFSALWYSFIVKNISLEIEFRWFWTGALIWSTYHLIIIAIDTSFFTYFNFPPAYFLSSSTVVLLIPFMSLLPKIWPHLGRSYYGLVMIIMAFLPNLMDLLVLPNTGIHPWFSFGDMQHFYIRQWIPNFISTMMVSIYFRRRFALTYIGVILAINIGNVAMQTADHPRILEIAFILFISGLLLADSFVLFFLRNQRTALHSANTRLLELASTVEDLAVSRERNRVARDLHDTLAHSLSGLIIQLEAIKAYREHDPALADKLITQSMETARTGLKETRRALSALRASPLEDLGLQLALQELVKTAAQKANLTFSMNFQMPMTRFPKETEQHIYRLAQEAVSNVVQHARAKNLSVKLLQNNGFIQFILEDDGVGFDINKDYAPGHFGIQGMIERAILSGGNLQVDSKPNEGTKITFYQEISTKEMI